MNALALPRLLARARRRKRKPKPPGWWVCVIFLAFCAALAIWDAAESDWLSLASVACNAVVWWRAFQSPGFRWDRLNWLFWWPLAMAFAIAGLIA